jgi:hypothetical protein
MTVESVTNISDLDINNPAGGDSISEGDDHLRNIKRAIKNTFPNITDPVTATAEDLNKMTDFASTGNGVFASLKWNGQTIMYGHNISSVVPMGTTAYRVNFKQPTDGFDHHYALQITPIATNARFVIMCVTDQRSDWAEFSVTESPDGNTWGPPSGPCGFYMTMVDMIQTEANANT